MLKRAIFPLLTLLLMTAGAYGQTGVGQIQGTVTDATGAVVPNATSRSDSCRPVRTSRPQRRKRES